MVKNHQKCLIWMFTPNICPNNINNIPVLPLLAIRVLASLAMLYNETFLVFSNIVSYAYQRYCPSYLLTPFDWLLQLHHLRKRDAILQILFDSCW